MKAIYILATAALLGAGGASAQKVAGIDYTNLDTDVKPGDDFWQYATGNWAANHPKPAGYTMWGTTSKVYDENTQMLASLIQDIASKPQQPGSIAEKIGAIYNMYMDSTRLDNEGGFPVMKYLEEVRSIEDRNDLLKYAAKHHSGILFGIGVGADSKDSKKNIVGIGQGGLGMGDRDYYLSDDPKKVELLEAYRQHGVNLMTMVGIPAEEAKQRMDRIILLETRLAEVHYSREQMRDPEANYHKMTVEELTERTAGFPWKKFLHNFKYDQTTEVDLEQPEPVALACQMLMKSAPLQDIKALLELRLISGATDCLSTAFEDEDLDYRSKLTGNKEKSPRWKRGVNLVSAVMSDAIGQMFVERHFPAEAKQEMTELVSLLQKALGNRIQAQEWMSDETKQVALDKLNAFTVKVGYPDKWDDLSGLTIDPSLSLLDNMKAVAEFYWQLDYQKRYNKPVDHTEWHMPAQMVNAYYNPSTNEICFPAGFLQAPLFDLKSDAAANFGSIGVVIGHEMTHGFDDQGRQFDKEGNLRQWWNDEDIERFKKPCDQMAEFFDQQWVIKDELHANGKLTLGENLADHGGLMVAYEAFQMWQKEHGKLPVDNGFTPEQRFFLSYANVWTDRMPEELKRYLTQMDVHSLSFLRVNGALPHIDAWYDAFHIQPGDPLYLAPDQRVRVW